jgi:hypothetical protein
VREALLPSRKQERLREYAERLARNGNYNLTNNSNEYHEWVVNDFKKELQRRENAKK